MKPKKNQHQNMFTHVTTSDNHMLTPEALTAFAGQYQRWNSIASAPPPPSSQAEPAESDEPIQDNTTQQHVDKKPVTQSTMKMVCKNCSRNHNIITEKCPGSITALILPENVEIVVLIEKNMQVIHVQ